MQEEPRTSFIVNFIVRAVLGMGLIFFINQIVLLLLPKGGLQTTVMFALAAWLVIYGLFLTLSLIHI